MKKGDEQLDATFQGGNPHHITESLSDITYYVYEESLRCPKTMALLNVTPAAGTNLGMVSHAGFFCNTVDSLAWSEAAIYKPQAPSMAYANCPS